MPNNGIVSTKTNIPDKFRVQSTGQIDASSDMVIVNQPLDGINVTQKSITINQLGQIISSSSTPTAFDVSTSGDLIISKNEGEYGDGPITIQNGDSFTVSNVALPSGLTWRSQYSGSTQYSLSDVVFNTVSGVYRTWVYINNTPSTGQALPSGSATSNTYWAQLGTQGPAGTNGVTGIKANAFSAISTGIVTFAGTLDHSVIGATQWQVSPFSNITGTVSLQILKPYKEFGFSQVAFNGYNGLPSGIFLIQNAYVNDSFFTSSNISLTYSSGTGEYTFSFPDYFFNYNNEPANLVTIKVGEEFGETQTIGFDMYMVKYKKQWGPNAVKFKIYKFSGGTWVQWVGSETPTLSIYLQCFNS